MYSTDIKSTKEVIWMQKLCSKDIFKLWVVYYTAKGYGGSQLTTSSS